jgi:hypothetical protein
VLDADAKRPEIVEKLAKEIADYRAIPFVGAGLSADHLGVDWDAIGVAMRAVIGGAPSDNISTAEEYIAARGRDDFCQLLKTYLHAKSFHADKGAAHLALMSLNTGIIYTTNQDNLIELCHAAHGRPLNTVVGLAELSQLRPADNVLYKFHGDLEQPSSIVFASRDYAARGHASHHPLDIRIKSDCLGKSLLFLGYSVRDPNVQQLLEHLELVFGRKIPARYLVQHRPDAVRAAELHSRFGIECIDCTALYGIADHVAAFDRFMSDLCTAAVHYKAGSQLQEMFRPSGPAPRLVVTSYQVDAVAAAVESGDFDRGLRAFRGSYDGAIVSDAFSDVICSQFVELCRMASAANVMTQLNGALFNLRLPDPGHALHTWAACCATANLLPKQAGGMPHLFLPHANGVPEELRVVAVVYAISLLEEWGRPLTPGFYDWVSFALQSFDLSVIPESARPAVEAVFAKAYTSGKTTYENPIARRRRLQALGYGHAGTSAREIGAGLEAMMPKRFLAPYRKS